MHASLGHLWQGPEFHSSAHGASGVEQIACYILDGAGSCQGCWPGYSAQSMACSLLLSLTPLWEGIWLELLGSLILVGAVLAVDESLMAVDVLCVQALSVVSDGVRDYPVHAQLCPHLLYPGGKRTVEQQWPVALRGSGQLCLYS